nr:hypothetical protein [Micromonospora sp. DSM 115978]
MVDLLEREALVADRISRDMLAAFTGDLLGGPLQVPEAAFRRQWLLAFVRECARHDGGLQAMVEALGRLDGHGRVHVAVAALVEQNGDVAQTGETVPARADRHSERLSPAEVDALAEAYSDRSAAR